jgi:putative SOS response-associated peptidase YedK
MVTQAVYSQNGKRKAESMRFGLIPGWAKDEKIGYKLFNARSETIFSKPTWKRAALSRRCVIPANGFYEWQKQTDGKHPFYIYPEDQPLFSFAGLYEHWTNQATGEFVPSFSIITTRPNKDMKPIHDRMPVILTKDQEEGWLSDEDNQDFLSSLLEPYPEGIIKNYEVSKLVNSAKNQGPELIKPI